MKKILTLLALASAATFAHGQGTVILNNAVATYFVSTNATAIGGTIGLTSKTAGQFSYALLTATYGGAVPSSNPLDAAWSGAALTGANWSVFAGGILGQGGGVGAPTAGTTWGAPAGSTYASGTEKYFMIVGWSTSYASTWAAFAPMLQTAGGLNGLAPGGFYGTSAIGYGFSGGGPNSLPAPSLFGVTTGMPGGLTSGFTLFSPAAVPEPTTIALAGLGGLALLALRRRTSK